MRRVLFCAVLLLSLPAAATISQVQSKANFGDTGATCQVTFTTQNPTRFNMIAVWTSWTTSGTNNVTVTFVKDQLNNGPVCDTSGHCTYASAVGPTVQSASSTAAQIFYAVVGTGGLSDPVTVTFSSAPSSSNCVIVEYSGLDTMYPLDSASAGYSYSAGNYLDSGTAAPANANLLVFGGGTSDTTATVVVESGFTSIQSNPGSITEQFINSPASPNNTLQRATACLSAISPCPTTGGGNWVMEMAVFRAASWGLAGGSPVFAGQNSITNPGTFAPRAQREYLSSYINGFDPTQAYGGSGGAIGQLSVNAVSGGVVVPAASTETSFAISGFVINSSSTAQSAAGYLVGICDANNALNCEGLNTLTFDQPGETGDKITGYEMDIGSQTGSTPNYLTGLLITGNNNGNAPSQAASQAISFTPGGTTPWGFFLIDSDGAAATGALFGAACNGSMGCDSQNLVVHSYTNAAPPVLITSGIQADETGNWVLTSSGVGLGGVRANMFLGNVGTNCASTNVTVGTGWGSSASVVNFSGWSQSCQFTIKAGSASFGSGPTITFTFPNAFPAIPICTLDVHAITGSGGPIMFDNTTQSSTAPLFTAYSSTGSPFTPAAGETFKVVLRCGP